MCDTLGAALSRRGCDGDGVSLVRERERTRSIWDRSEGYYAVLLCAAMGVRWRSEGVLLHRAMASHKE